MVLVLKQTSSNPPTEFVEILDRTGRLLAGNDFTAPAVPTIDGCSSIAPPAVRVAAHAAFFADSTGTIHRLDVNGAQTVVATFPITPESFLSFAVSPDGRDLTAIVITAPAGSGSGDWTLDLETTIAGGTTTTTFHRDLGHGLPSPGPTLITGWDDFGMTATLNSLVCIQQPIPSREYTGRPLVRLAPDGTHLETIGGAGCGPLGELMEGTVLCDSSDGNRFSVRGRNGQVLWGAEADGALDEPVLSPDGKGVVVNDPDVQLFRQGAQQAVSLAQSTHSRTVVLGWAGDDSILVLKDGLELGLMSVDDPTTIVAIGSSLHGCTTCITGPISFPGVIGL